MTNNYDRSQTIIDHAAADPDATVTDATIAQTYAILALVDELRQTPPQRYVVAPDTDCVHAANERTVQEMLDRNRIAVREPAEGDRRMAQKFGWTEDTIPPMTGGYPSVIGRRSWPTTEHNDIAYPDGLDHEGNATDQDGNPA